MEISDWLEHRRTEIVDFACQLIATPSQNPPGDERQIAQTVCEKLNSFGIDEFYDWSQSAETTGMIAVNLGALCLTDY